MKSTTLLRALLALSLLSSTLFAFAQDPFYSQFYASPILLNPAFTGATDGPRAALNFRNQWSGIYQQYAVAGDMPLHFLGSRQGVGLSVQRDVAALSLKKTNILAHYSYEIQINDDNALRLGLSAGIESASIDYSLLTFPSQIDASNGAISKEPDPIQNRVNTDQRAHEDLNVGVAYYNKYAFAGVSVMHLTNPEETFNSDVSKVTGRLPRRYNVSGGIRIPLGDFRHPEKLNITPAFLFMQQGRASQVNVGAYLNAAPMTFGFWYRHGDAVVAMIGIEKKPFRVGYSYDYTVGELGQSNTGGSHELTMVFQIEQAKKRRGLKHKSLPCPHY